MEPDELEEGATWAVAEFYSRSSILSRFAYNWRHPLIFMMMNASYRGKNREILGKKTSEDGEKRLLLTSPKLTDGPSYQQRGK
jgi:hypothetical protein